jgi:hypothetical protein
MQSLSYEFDTHLVIRSKVIYLSPVLNHLNLVCIIHPHTIYVSKIQLNIIHPSRPRSA